MKNLAQCDLETLADNSFKINSWTVETCVEAGLNVNKTPLHELAPFFSTYVKKNLKKWLYENSDTSEPKDFSRVFIENQPMGGRGAARNLKTKVLSHILQCAILDERPGLKVDFVHPGLKLKDMERTEGQRSTYRENKLYAIEATTTLVQSDSNATKDLCKTLFLDKKNGKKDDLADAFLQGLIAGKMHASGQVVTPPEVPKKARKQKSKASPPDAAAAAVAIIKAEATEKPVVAAAAVAAPKAPEVDPVTPSGKRPRTKK